MDSRMQRRGLCRVVTIAPVVSGNDVGVFDVTWGADADVLATVPHGITSGGLGGSGGAIPQVAEIAIPPAPGTAAAQRLGDVRPVSVDATNVVLSKTNAGGSSPIVTRVIVARNAQQLSAVKTALFGALAAQMGSGS